MMPALKKRGSVGSSRSIKSHGATKVAEVVTTLLLLGLAALIAAGVISPALASVVSLLSDTLSVSLDFLYRLVVTNEGMLGVALMVLMAGILREPTGRMISSLPPGAGRILHLLWMGFLSLLVLVAQAYMLSFAALASTRFLALMLALGFGAGWAATRLLSRNDSPEQEPGFHRVPLPVFVSWLAIYLHLGLVQGHLATPVVHGAASAMAALSATSPLAYRLVATALLLLPLIPWLPRVIRTSAGGDKQRRALKLAPLALILPLALPTHLAPYLTALMVAAGLGGALASARFLPLRLAHPDPRVLMARLLLLSSLALTAAMAHYLAVTWNCDGAASRHHAVRLLSSEPGAFDLATTPDGQGLLVSLREPRRVIRIDLKTGKARTWVAPEQLGDGSGHLFSWTEPENLLPLGELNQVLMLRAVSDDEELNQVLVMSAEGRNLGPLQSIPRGGVSDMIADGAGSLFLSKEFDGSVFQLDAATLTPIRTLHWPDAETNKVIADPRLGRIYSLGLWFDPYLRAMDLRSEREVGRLELGTLNWDMTLDPRSGRLFVPKFASGQVRVIDPVRMEVVDSWPAGFGARAVDLDPDRRLLYVGSMHAGRVKVLHLDSGADVMDLRLGGYIKGLHVDRRSHKAYTGCACGVFEINPDKLEHQMESSISQVH